MFIQILDQFGEGGIGYSPWLQIEKSPNVLTIASFFQLTT